MGYRIHNSHIVRLSNLRAFTRIGRVFGVLTGYLDDSYDDTTVVCGGWVARDKVWERIEPRWVERLEHENRISRKLGLAPITRYHATYCANCTGEFKGWDIPRQIRFVKRLVAIMRQPLGTNKPAIFSWGISLSEVRSQMPNWRREDLLNETYKYCVRKCIWEIGRFMHECLPDEKVTFIHDSGKLFPAALAGFNEIKNAPESAAWKHQLVTIAPMDWEQCVPLQPADMVAYDTFKVVKRRLHTDPNAVRKSLEALVGNMPVVAGYLPPGEFTKILRDSQKRNRVASDGGGSLDD